LAVESALAEALETLDNASGETLETTRRRHWSSADFLGPPVSGSPVSSLRRRLTQPAGALHWATPDTISKFGDDSDDDSAYFTDDGI